MKLSHRKAYDDWHSAEQRMAGHRKEPDYGWMIDLIQGFVCIGLVMLMLWFVWQLSTPAGMDAIRGFAVYLWSAI